MTIVTVTSGPRNARIDPDSGLRFYTWQGRELPSVTSVRSMAGVPFRLMTWHIARVCDRAVDELDTLNEMMSRPKKARERVLEKNRRTETRRWLRSAAEEERDRAARRGTAIHQAAEHGLTPETVGDWTDPETGIVVTADEIRPKLRQYLSWLSDSGAEVLLKERQVWNLTYGYAGSFDMIVRFRDGSLWIVDLKTGSGTYSDHVLQQVAYAHAEFIGQDDVIDQEATELLHRVTGVAILHLRDDGWTFIQPTAGEAEWEAYRGLLAFAGWTHAHPDVESFTAASREGADKYEQHAAQERQRLLQIHLLESHQTTPPDVTDCDVCRFLTALGGAA